MFCEICGKEMNYNGQIGIFDNDEELIPSKVYSEFECPDCGDITEIKID